MPGGGSGLTVNCEMLVPVRPVLFVVTVPARSDDRQRAVIGGGHLEGRAGGIRCRRTGIGGDLDRERRAAVEAGERDLAGREGADDIGCRGGDRQVAFGRYRHRCAGGGVGQRGHGGLPQLGQRRNLRLASASWTLGSG